MQPCSSIPLSNCRLLIPKADFTRRYFAAHKTMARALVAACGLGGQRAAMVLDWQKVRLIYSSDAAAGCALLLRPWMCARE
jgi:hypothetical protein